MRAAGSVEHAPGSSIHNRTADSNSSRLGDATVAAANSQPRMRWMRFGVWVGVQSSSQHRRGAPSPASARVLTAHAPKANCCLHVCDAFLPARPTRLHTDAPTSALPSQPTVSLAAHSCAPRRTCTHVHLHLCAAHAKLGRTLVATAVRRRRHHLPCLHPPPLSALRWWDGHGAEVVFLSSPSRARA